ncbi:MAG TPA: amidohydrolase family protein [Vicinamibacterales bacterium]|jgi:predicted TIM-barrel fold metal-dependent hydrolase
MRKIDIFTHISPPGFSEGVSRVAGGLKDIGKRSRGVPMLHDLDIRFKVMDSFPEYQQVLSVPTPPIELFATPAEAVDLARIANDSMANLVQKHPDRFVTFAAALPMNAPDAALAETQRAVTQLGAKAIQVHSNILGKPLTSPEFLPIFEAMAGYDLPILLHPYRGADFTDYLSEQSSEFEIWWTFGWPYDTSAAMARMVFAGFFDKWPSLKIVAHHMGAMVPYFAGRVGPGWDQLGKRTSDRDLSTVLTTLKKRPLDYFKMFYADTALFGAYEATVCGLDFYGVDNVVFASDAPFDPENGPMYIRETTGIIDRLPLTNEQREQIYWRNAAKLLKVN